MKTYAASVTAELKCPLLRMYQIDANLNELIGKLAVARANPTALGMPEPVGLGTE